MENCDWCSKMGKLAHCQSCSHLHKGFKLCENCRFNLDGYPACLICTNVCSKCEKIKFRSELYPTADWDVCANCL